MDEEILRQELKTIHDDKGVRYSFISTKIGIHKSTLSHFIKGDRKTGQDVINLISDYIYQYQ